MSNEARGGVHPGRDGAFVSVEICWSHAPARPHRSMRAVHHFHRPIVRRTRRMLSPFLRGSSARAASVMRISHLQTDRRTKPFWSAVVRTSAVTRCSPILMSFFFRLPFSSQIASASFERTQEARQAEARPVETCPGILAISTFAPLAKTPPIALRLRIDCSPISSRCAASQSPPRPSIPALFRARPILWSRTRRKYPAGYPA